jgi:hypothetical protein
MSQNPKSSLFVRGLRVLVVSLALFAGTAAAAQAASAAQAAPAAAIQAVAPAHQAPVSVAATWACTNFLYSNAVERFCDISSGFLRSYLSCTDGFTYFTDWRGVGSWYYLQICPPGHSWVGSGVQTIG